MSTYRLFPWAKMVVGVALCLSTTQAPSQTTSPDIRGTWLGAEGASIELRDFSESESRSQLWARLEPGTTRTRIQGLRSSPDGKQVVDLKPTKAGNWEVKLLAYPPSEFFIKGPISMHLSLRELEGNQLEFTIKGGSFARPPVLLERVDAAGTNDFITGRWRERASGIQLEIITIPSGISLSFNAHDNPLVVMNAEVLLTIDEGGVYRGAIRGPTGKTTQLSIVAIPDNSIRVTVDRWPFQLRRTFVRGSL